MVQIPPETATLKPCPFCGSAPIMDVHHENEDGTGIIEFVVVRCSSCRTSKERPSPSAAAQAWNRRFEFAQTPADLGMQGAVQYRRKDGGYGPRWITMAMFDGALAAESYCSRQRKDDKWPFEYRAIELSATPDTSTDRPAPDRERVARAICCPSGCSYRGDSEDGEKCYCDTSDFNGSGIEKKTDAVLAALSVTSPTGNSK